MLSPVFDSFNQDRSRSGATDLSINLYPEHSDGDKGPEISLLLNAPGLTAPLVTAGAGPIRGAYRAANNVMYVCSGNALYAVSTLWVATLIGTIGTSTGPVQMIDNPTSVQVVDGAAGWLITKSNNALSQNIPQANVSAVSPYAAVYQDGFGLINSTDNQVYQSNNNDLSLYATNGVANNAYIQGNAENVVTMYDMKREVWIFKKDAVEVWVNNGNAGFAFIALQGVYIPVGCTAAASVSKLGNGMAWLGENEQGVATVYLSVGYEAKPITTYALAALFQGFTTVSDAQAYTYQSGDHQFYVLTFPTADVTYAYDLVTGKWHQRASMTAATGRLHREIANCHCWFNKTHVVGDYVNGNLYGLSDTTYTDNGVARPWKRSWRALTPDNPVGVAMSFDELQVLMETGITTPDGTNPQITLRWSDDGGYTWPGQVLMEAGKPGETARRVIARRLGSTKIGTGLDRIWEISSTAPIRVAITGASWEGGPS
jgi:hypothetical protein